jgi:hypothetical protein
MTRRIRDVVVAAGLGGAALAWTLGGAAGADELPFTTPGTHTFVVPAGVTQLGVLACGAQGGDGGDALISSAGAGGGMRPAQADGFGGPGGQGARVQGVLSVTGGETLRITVGGAGTDGDDFTGDPGVAGGVGGAVDGDGGGGDGGGGNTGGGGGGGSSDIRQDGTSASNRVVVAGGGGAGGAGDLGGGMGGAGGDGGSGGTDGGDAGSATGGDSGGNGGQGGVEDGGDGSATTGGEGGSPSVAADGGGGGGGGLLGGGGGGSEEILTGGGGGGGSSQAPTAGAVEDGACSGDGFVVVTFTPGAAPAGPAAPVVGRPTLTG